MDGVERESGRDVGVKVKGERKCAKLQQDRGINITLDHRVDVDEWIPDFSQQPSSVKPQ